MAKVQFLARTSFCHCVKTGCQTHQNSYTMGTEDSFFRGNLPSVKLMTILHTVPRLRMWEALSACSLYIETNCSAAMLKVSLLIEPRTLILMSPCVWDCCSAHSCLLLSCPAIYEKLGSSKWLTGIIKICKMFNSGLGSGRFTIC